MWLWISYLPFPSEIFSSLNFRVIIRVSIGLLQGNVQEMVAMPPSMLLPSPPLPVYLPLLPQAWGKLNGVQVCVRTHY